MRQVVTAMDVPASGDLRVSPEAIVTAVAREIAAARGVRILEVPKDQVSRSEEHTSELQSLRHLVCRLLLEKKKKKHKIYYFFVFFFVNLTFLALDLFC